MSRMERVRVFVSALVLCGIIMFPVVLFIGMLFDLFMNSVYQ